MYNISFANLMMLAKCVPNYSLHKDKDKDKDTGAITRKTGKNEMPEFGKRGNLGSFDALISFFKGIQAKNK